LGVRNPAHPVSYWDKLLANIVNAAAIYGTDKLIIVGDLNDDLLHPPCHLSDVIDTLNMFQLVEEPTHFTSHSESLLEPTIVGQPNLFKNISVLPQGVSNHCPVVIEISSNTPKIVYKHSIWLFN
jgi:hypothetical protein